MGRARIPQEGKEDKQIPQPPLEQAERDANRFLLARYLRFWRRSARVAPAPLEDNSPAQQIQPGREHK